MGNKLIIIMGILLLTAPLVSCKQSGESRSKVSASEQARFNHNRDVFNNEENKEIRAEELSNKESAETKKKLDETQDKGEGQVNVKF